MTAAPTRMIRGQYRQVVTRIWDENYTLAFVIDEPIVDGQLVLPIDHDAAKWLRDISDRMPVVRASVDEPIRATSYVPGRENYLLTEFRVRRNGTCPECDHCQTAVLETHWAEETSASISWTPSTSVVVLAGSGGRRGGGGGGTLVPPTPGPAGGGGGGGGGGVWTGSDSSHVRIEATVRDEPDDPTGVPAKL